MPEMTIFLDDELAARLGLEASLQRVSPEAALLSLLRQHLPERRYAPLAAKAGQVLVEQLGAQEPSVRAEASRALRELGMQALPYLQGGLSTKNSEQARGIAELLAHLASSETVELLLELRYQAPQEAHEEIDHELRIYLQNYGMRPEESGMVLEHCCAPLVPLVARWLRDTLRLSWPLGPVSFERLQERFSDSPPTKETARCVIALLERGRIGNTAQVAAQTLTFLAEVAPSPALRHALPLLRSSWRQPFPPREFVEATRAIEAATEPWKNLPLPSETRGERASHNLPVPVDNSG